MSARTAPQYVATPDEVADVAFDDAMEAEIVATLAKYPTKQAALLPVLWIAQRRWGWISPGVVDAIAERLDLSPAYIQGVVTFYTMYQTAPPGRYLIQVCVTLSCQLCGTPELVEALKAKLGVDWGGTTPDGRFTLLGVQCLGACGEAPIVQINDDYYTHVTAESIGGLLDGLR